MISARACCPRCPLCLEALLDTEDQYRWPCLHAVHERCLPSWSSYQTRPCPVCRTPSSDAEGVEDDEASDSSSAEGSEYEYITPPPLIPLCCKRVEMHGEQLVTIDNDRRMIWAIDVCPILHVQGALFLCNMCGRQMWEPEICRILRNHQPPSCPGHGLQTLIVDGEFRFWACAIDLDGDSTMLPVEDCEYGSPAELNSNIDEIVISDDASPPAC